MKVIDTTTGAPVLDEDGDVVDLPFMSAQLLASHLTRSKRLHVVRVVETITFGDNA